MGCHLSHWLIFFKMVIAPPSRNVITRNPQIMMTSMMRLVICAIVTHDQSLSEFPNGWDGHQSFRISMGKKVLSKFWKSITAGQLMDTSSFSSVIFQLVRDFRAMFDDTRWQPPLKSCWRMILSLVGGDWNHGIFMTFRSVGNVIIPTDFNSIVFQRGRLKPPTRFIIDHH